MYETLIGSIIGFFILAVWNTFNKEKDMVQSGGEPLGTSSYVFLLLQHVIWVLIILGLDFLQWFAYNVTGLIQIGLTILVFITTYWLTKIIEVLIRVAVVRYYQSKIQSELKKRDDVNEY